MLEADIKNLIKILEGSNINEMEVSTFWGKQRIRIQKNANAPTEKSIEIMQDKSIETNDSNKSIHQNIEADNDLVPAEPESTAQEDKVNEQENILCIKAPLVGTFYRSPKPEDPPFIVEGDSIKEGQVICIIEAMKIFNEIESEFSGKVEKILINDSTPVEYDQELILVDPE